MLERADFRYRLLATKLARHCSMSRWAKLGHWKDVDMFEKTFRTFPGANQEQISTFKEYIERQVASNRDSGERLLRAKDCPEAFRIQADYFRS